MIPKSARRTTKNPTSSPACLRLRLYAAEMPHLYLLKNRQMNTKRKATQSHGPFVESPQNRRYSNHYQFLHVTSTARPSNGSHSTQLDNDDGGVTPRVLDSVEARVYYDLAPHGHIPARDLSLT